MDESLDLPSATPRDENIFKILVASDIHLGYNDNNPARENDSFVTFEEILKMGRDENVDFVLLGGDLFHENKPKPACLHRAMEIMRKYCLGSKPVEFEYLGDPKINFPNQDEPEVNYQCPDINIALPVFTIHGNHDDPIGVKKTSAVDHLVAAKLLNHFGQWNNLNDITVMPVPLVKGETKIALYGLGNLKDERLFRLIRDQKIKFVRPKETKEDWFNIFVLHQNRVKHGPTNYIPEGFIPAFFDLAIWGHEHECRITPEQPDPNVRTYIAQPGSPVATSLCLGESVPKRVGILHVDRRRFRMEEKQLQTVRPFEFKDLDLREVLPNLSKEKDGSGKVVEKYVETLVKGLLRDSVEKLTGHEGQPVDPLIRVRVYHERTEDTFNPVRFAQKFAGQVVNDDIVIFKRITGKREQSGDMDVEDMNDMIRAQQDDLDTHVETIVEAHFVKARADGDQTAMLEVLAEKGLSEAVKASVEKDDKESISVIIESQMEKAIKFLMSREVTEENIEEELENFNLRRNAHPDAESTEAAELLRHRLPKPQPTSNGTDEEDGANGHGSDEDQDNDGSRIDDDEDDISVVGFGRRGGQGSARNQQTGGATARGRGRGRGRGKTNISNGDEDSFETSPPPQPKARGRGRGASSTSAASGRGRGRGSTAGKTMVQTTLQVRRSPRKNKSGINFDDTDSD